MKQPDAHYRQATRAAWLGLIVNLVLGAVKLVAGVVAASFALISDAVNSLGDALTSIVVLAGLEIAQRPPDEGHPYGHTRAEAVAASNVALLIVISALWLLWQALGPLPAPPLGPPLWALAVAGANVVIKETLYQYKVRVGRRTGSIAVIANAQDHRNDALASLAVLVGLAVSRWAGPDYAWADRAAAIVVVAMILFSGLRLLRTSAGELLDPQADGDLVARIRAEAESVPGVDAVEKLWVRKTGIEYLADIHIQVDPRMSVEEGHEIGHAVKSKLVARFGRLRDVLVHLEPFTG